MDVIYLSSDNTLLLSGLQNKSSLAYLNAATVTCRILDNDGNEVSGETWPLTMSYVASTNGNYSVTLADTLVLARNARYTAEVTADGGAGLKRVFELPLECIAG